MDYKLPNPETNPVDCLVLSYKTLKGIQYDDRDWDKVHWGRCKKAAKLLIELCKDLRSADKCLMEISEKFEAQSLSWTLETVLRHVHEWQTLNQKKEDKNNGLSPRTRLFADLAKSRTESTNSIAGTEATGTPIPSMLRSDPGIGTTGSSRAIRQPAERVQIPVRSMVETEVSSQPPVQRGVGSSRLVRLDELRPKRIPRTDANA